MSKPTFKTKLIIVSLNFHINQLRDTDETLLSSNYKFLAKQEHRPRGGAAEGKVVLHQRQMTAPCSFGGALRDDEQWHTHQAWWGQREMCSGVQQLVSVRKTMNLPCHFQGQTHRATPLFCSDREGLLCTAGISTGTDFRGTSRRSCGKV